MKFLQGNGINMVETMDYMTLESLAKMLLNSMNKSSVDSFADRFLFQLEQEGMDLETFAFSLGLDETATFKQIIHAYINNLTDRKVD